MRLLPKTTTNQYVELYNQVPMDKTPTEGSGNILGVEAIKIVRSRGPGSLL